MPQTIGLTIVAQLGGARFVAASGATHLVMTERGLRFHLSSARDEINAVAITLEQNNTHTLTFSLVRGARTTTVATIEGVHAANLREVFAERTGLSTSLESR
jgi:hypothetical protein